ncbi:MAG: hypothetical protein C4312_01065, partial [Thermoflexus sp.]
MRPAHRDRPPQGPPLRRPLPGVPGAAGAGRMNGGLPMDRRWITGLAALLAFIADQASKAWVREHLALYESWAPIPALARYFTFTHVTNTGIAFGLFRE